MSMNTQRGVSLGGLMVVLFIVIMLALLGFKLIPPYMEYLQIKKDFKAISLQPEVRNGTRGNFDQAWSRYATIDNIQSVDGSEIEFTKEGGEVVISAAYSVKVPLFANLSACLDFKPTTAGK
jgi:hypothetical protein